MTWKIATPKLKVCNSVSSLKLGIWVFRLTNEEGDRSQKACTVGYTTPRTGQVCQRDVIPGSLVILVDFSVEV